MTHPPQSIAELQLSIDYAERTIAQDRAELRQHVERMNWLYRRRNELTKQIERDRRRIAEAARNAVASS